MEIHVDSITLAEVNLGQLGLLQVTLFEVILVESAPKVETSASREVFLEVGEQELPNLRVHDGLDCGGAADEVLG